MSNPKTTRRKAPVPRLSWVSPKIAVRESAIRGHGVFALADIRKGEVVTVAGGRVIAEGEYRRLKSENREFVERYSMQIADGFFLIAGERDRDLEADDFFNHSCQPNCGIRGQLLMVALRRIRKGEELTYDYVMTDADPELRMECHCGAQTCRGTVTGNDWKLPALQRKYAGHFSWYLEERIAALRKRRPRAARLRG
jgi:hypothetical protein